MQEQFLDVIDRDEAERRFRAALELRPLGEELVPLAEAWQRVLARDVVSEVDVPSFDRSNFDGYAVRAADTYGASEEVPRRLTLLAEVLSPGVTPRCEVAAGTAVTIATGGMLPRGADAVVMVEHADADGSELRVAKAVAPGFGVTFTGTDVAAGETVLWRGELLTSRETGVLAAVGCHTVSVWRRPKVAVLSTGDELTPPGEPMRPGLVYDSNARILADALRELGCEPLSLGIVRDDLDLLRRRLQEGLQTADAVLLSGGTSKGEGDLCYKAVRELRDPGIVVHGVALKPGKPLCLAAAGGKPVVVLPGFPTSAIFTFHQFVAPVLLLLGGRTAQKRGECAARLAVKVNSEIGRTEYVLVGLVASPAVDEENSGERGATEAPPLSAYPMGKGSGSVTTFSRADGFITVARHEEIVEGGAEVRVQLLSDRLQVADLVAIGSHCVGLDYLLGQLQERGLHAKFLAVGSMGGLAAARRGECDMAGVHLLDPASGTYNRPFLSEGLELLPGYGRMQGLVFRRGDKRFEGRMAAEAVAEARHDAATVMVNRNQGSGTRVLIDQLLQGTQPAGYGVQAKNHNAVAAAVAQGRADWGLAIEHVARRLGLGFLPLVEERYDFVVPRARWRRPAVALLRQLLSEPDVQRGLRELGCRV